MRTCQQPPIAIVGMASIFPQATTLQAYWDNIVNKVNAIIDVPPTHWAVDDYYDPDPRTPDKVYSKRGGFLPEIDFNPLEYGLPPNILEVTDTSQLLSLVVAKDALADAGYSDAAESIRSRTGIVLGVGGGQKLITPLIARLQYPVWRKVLKSAGVLDDEIDTLIEKMKLAYVRWEENSFPGLLGNVITGRIANRLDLGGINTVVDAACASSLSALNLAVDELALGHADMMISGGVDTDNSVFMYMCFSKTPAFSPGEQCRPFDSQSDGMMVGEGVGMVVLKRLEDAERDGDRIYAVIKAVGSSSDGRYKSIYAPRSEGQERALRRAYERAGVSPASVGLIEAHGTGTVAGDITEGNTLVRYVGGETDRKHSIALGSVKSQIGHTKAAAGAAGLIKAALALHHQVLPPMINIDEPNPKLNLADSPFYLNTEARPWVSPDGPRRAGVSAFGFGGTNFHAVLEEYTDQRNSRYRLQSTAQLILLAAATPAELRTLCETQLSGLEGENTAQVFKNLVQTIPEVPLNAARVGFVAQSADEAANLLRTALQLLTSQPDADHWEHPKGIYYRKSSLDLQGKVVALFSGQGSQYTNMGRELALNFPPIRAAFEAMDAQFDADTSLAQIVYPIAADDDKLRQTEYAQPAIGAFSVGLYNVLHQAGFRPDFVAGHSFGELTALWAAHAISDDDYATLVHARGQAMAPQDTPGFDAGTMLAVTGNIANLEQAIAPFPGVIMANLNSPKQVVLAGPRDSIQAAQSALSAQGYNTIPLTVSAAFHTPLVEHAQKPFAEAIQRAAFRAPDVAVYSNMTADAYSTDPAAIQQQLSNHILHSVQFQREIENIHAAGGYLFVEFGPRNVLTNLVKDILKDKPHQAIALNASHKKDSDIQFRDAVAQLCVLGLPLGAFDPYAFVPEVPAEPARKGVQVTLTGTNYVSDKTRQVFEDALNDGFTLTRNAPAPEPVAIPVPPAPEAAPALPVAMDRSMAIFEAQQREMMAVHEHYIANQTEYFRLVSQLSDQQQRLIETGSLTPDAIENLTHNLVRLHDYQAETLRIHEQYLRRQSEGMQAFMALLRDPHAASAPVPEPAPIKATAPLPAAPVPTPAVPQVATLAPKPAPQVAIPVAPVSNGHHQEMVELSGALVVVISEKTGYPADVLDLSMDMESDLGIDSIKRVEILGAMRERFPHLPPFNAEELTELRTLQEIADYMHAQIGGPSSSAPAHTAPVPAPAPQAAIPTAPVSNGHHLEMVELSGALVVVISEKTGYPADVLDLSMDMESDLGIDSIKRVEILGAMRERFPHLPPFNAEELTELRTLQEIADYMHAQIGGPSSSAPAHAAPVPEPAPQVAIPAAPVSNGHHLEMVELSGALVVVISEKTGYPADVLDLSMDMESDLGIDSIKRVEILGAMRERFPHLPPFNAEELTELRTLQEIADYMHAQIADPEVQPSDFFRVTHDLPRHTVALRTLPHPDFLDFALLEGAVCLITDDGTPLTAALAQALTTRGWRVVVLSFPASVFPPSPDLNAQRVILPDLSEAALQAALETINGPIQAFIHLNPAHHQLSRNGDLFVSQQKTILKHVFLLAKHLKPALAANNARHSFITVARLDGALGIDPKGDIGAISGGLFGLTKTLNLEWPATHCRALDVAQSIAAPDAAQYILAELHDPNRLIVEVAYGPAGRTTLVAQSSTLAQPH